MITEFFLFCIFILVLVQSLVSVKLQLMPLVSSKYRSIVIKTLCARVFYCIFNVGSRPFVPAIVARVSPRA